MLAAFAGAADDAETISLSGPRKATAQISGNGDHLDVAVRMIGVRSFDRATNDRCNREKATSYAIAALKRHFAPQARELSIRIKGQEVLGTGYDGKTFELVLRVPRDGFVIAETGARPSASTKRAKTPRLERAEADEEQEARGASSDLLTAKQDYLDTIMLLAAKWSERLPATPDDGAAANGFYRQIADAEEGIAADFAALTREIKADKKLLSLELEELLATAAEKENSFVRDLTERVKAFEGQSQGIGPCK